MADFHTDMTSINYIVHHSKSEDDARIKFNNLSGISIPKHTAQTIFKDAVTRTFSKQKAQASYSSIVAKHYGD